MNCLSGATNMLNKNDKEKYVNSGYVITFNSTDRWSFGISIDKNVLLLVLIIVHHHFLAIAKMNFWYQA